jgi:hypothetical protein
MADEITFNFRFNVANGTYEPGPITISNLQLDQTLAGESGGIITVTTSDNVTLDKTNLTNPGLLFMRNVESTTTTNVVSWGFSTDGMDARMEPSEFAVIRTSTAANVYAKHTTGTGGAKLHYRWLND